MRHSWLSLVMITALSVPLAFFEVKNAQAGCSNFDPFCKESIWRRVGREADITDEDSWIRNPTLKTFNVHVKNNTKEHILVHARWYHKRVIGPSGQYEEIWDSGDWIVGPGEKAFIIDDAVSRYIYLSAKSMNDGGYWKEKEVDMGGRYTNFFYNFNP